MCYQISSDAIIVNYFAVNPEKKDLSFIRLERIVNNIKTISDYAVLAETNKNALYNLVSSNRCVFELGPTYISLIGSTEIFSQLQMLYLGSIPSEIKEICNEAILNSDAN